MELLQGEWLGPGPQRHPQDVEYRHPVGQEKPSYTVRWAVDGAPMSASYKTKALADRFRAKLLRAIEKGEPFDTVTGLPGSLRGGKAALTFLELSIKYVDGRWAEAAAKQRDSMTDALATVLPALVKEVRGRPDNRTVRRALRSYVLPPSRRERERSDEIAATVRWLEKASLPVPELHEIARAHELIDARWGGNWMGSPLPRKPTGGVGRSSSTSWSTP